MEMNGAKILIETLIEQGVKTVFGYPGGQVLNLYDELYLASDRINHVLTAHEQGAAHAADGYARATGEVGVCIATSGPGATNLVTGIATAFLDSVPMVAVTGNVPCDLLGRDSFQEVDIYGVTQPITKHNYIVKDVTKLADTVREAFSIAKSGRPGPVLIDIPKDVQIAVADYEPVPVVKTVRKSEISEKEVNKALELIEKAKRPYIYCGGGVISADAKDEILKLAELCDAPIGFSLMGLSAVPSSNKRSLGMVGMHGHFAATKAMYQADLIIAVGVRFSDRATGNKEKYAAGADIIHIDIDAAEINKNINVKLGISCDVKKAVAEICNVLPQQTHDHWQTLIADFRDTESKYTGDRIGELTPYDIIESVNKISDASTPVATDVGQHQMWTAQHYDFRDPRTFISSGGLGTMGFGMGAAIGACIGTGKRTVLFTGDGSFGMNLNELATAVSQSIPLVIIIMNNGVLGMVRQWQKIFYNEHYSSTTLNRATDFVKLAEAFGAVGMRAATKAEFDECISKAFQTNSTVLIDCIIDNNERVLLMIPAGKSVDDLILK